MSAARSVLLNVDARPFAQAIRRATRDLVIDAAHTAALEEDRARTMRKARFLALVVAGILAAVAFPHLAEGARVVGTATALLLVGVYCAVRLAINDGRAARRRRRA